ncbi:MAG: PAS domain S-box protein [Geobacteraceae bacterium]|nr:PAS domain S-box protein [Geobacteraceae bacterium]
MNFNIIRPVSIKAKMTILTLVFFVIGIWSLVWYASRILRDDMEKLLGEQQYSTVSMVARQINDEISNRMLALEAVARGISPSILNNAATLQALLEQQPLLQIMFNSGLFVARTDGTAIVDVPHRMQRTGINYLDRDYMIAALKEGKSSIGRPIIGRGNKSPSFAMAVPIRDAQGNVKGALMGATDLGRPNFLDNLTMSSYGPTGGFLLITPRYRQVITATDKKRIMEVLPAAGVNRYVDRNIAGYEGYSLLVNPLGEEQLASVKQIPAAGWYLLLGTPTTEAFQPIRTLQWRVLLAAFVLSLLAGGLIWWLTSRMLRSQLSPMITAAEMVNALAAGNRIPQPLPVIRQDEIGQLVGGFNRLLLSLGQRENALKESEENLAITLQSIGDGVISTDEAGRVTRLNPTAERLCGWPLADAAGRPLAEVFRIVNANTREAVTDPVHVVMASGQVVGLANHSLLLARGGQEYQIADSAAPIRNAAGEIVGVVLVFSDVTDKYRAEQKLRESEEGNRLLVTNLSSGLVVHASDTTILFSNPMASTILGLSSDQMRGKQAIDPAWCFFGENGIPLPLEEYPVNRVRLSGESIENQILGIHRPDLPEPIWVLCNAYPVTGARGELLKVVVTFSDITLRKQIEDELRAKSAEIEQFIYTVSHDLRSPLVTIKTFMGYLEKDMAEGNRESLAQDIHYIHGAADKMKLLLDELLEFSRIGRIEAPLVKVPLRELLDEVLGTMAGAISERSVDIHLPEAGLIISGDRTRLSRLWQNLIENAVKYSRNDIMPRIEIGWQQVNAETVFFVQDNGIGINPSHLGRIFGIFEKLDPGSPGAGLGLSMVQRIVEKYGGRIWVESDGTGTGSCFRFTLPWALKGEVTV